MNADVIGRRVRVAASKRRKLRRIEEEVNGCDGMNAFVRLRDIFVAEEELIRLRVGLIERSARIKLVEIFPSLSIRSADPPAASFPDERAAFP